MAQKRRSPYIWVTWAAKLLTGDASCEWSSWFRSQHESWSWTKRPSDFDQAGWMLRHTAFVNRLREEWEDEGHVVTTEAQNAFTLRGSAAALAGKPDLVAVRDGVGTVIDTKTGKPSPSHSAQVMLYQYALPRALDRYRGMEIKGQVAYPDHTVDIPAEAVDEEFILSLRELIQRLTAETPARRVPSALECRFCDITAQDCPERVEDVGIQEGLTEDF